MEYEGKHGALNIKIERAKITCQRYEAHRFLLLEETNLLETHFHFHEDYHFFKKIIVC